MTETETSIKAIQIPDSTLAPLPLLRTFDPKAVVVYFANDYWLARTSLTTEQLESLQGISFAREVASEVKEFLQSENNLDQLS